LEVTTDGCRAMDEHAADASGPALTIRALDSALTKVSKGLVTSPRITRMDTSAPTASTASTG
jgi:hypothetical protein